MKRIRITHDGFHGINTVHIMVPDEVRAGDILEILEAVANRINDAVCPGSDCDCGEALAFENGRDGWTICLPTHDERIRGRYPLIN